MWLILSSLWLGCSWAAVVNNNSSETFGGGGGGGVQQLVNTTMATSTTSTSSPNSGSTIMPLLLPIAKPGVVTSGQSQHNKTFDNFSSADDSNSPIKETVEMAIDIK